jgi:hypothetical protein
MAQDGAFMAQSGRNPPQSGGNQLVAAARAEIAKVTPQAN